VGAGVEVVVGGVVVTVFVDIKRRLSPVAETRTHPSYKQAGVNGAAVFDRLGLGDICQSNYPNQV